NSSNEIGALIGLGYSYNMAGQKNQAISTFQQLVSLLQKSSANDPSVDAAISNYQTIIQRLQAGEFI
ncbi:MAG: hypothetical protein ACREF7_01890, partial [Candidatus Saccharimonadales bacterium]